jgi:hypothetical protein
MSVEERRKTAHKNFESFLFWQTWGCGSVAPATQDATTYCQKSTSTRDFNHQQ